MGSRWPLLPVFPFNNTLSGVTGALTGAVFGGALVRGVRGRLCRIAPTLGAADGPLLRGLGAFVVGCSVGGRTNGVSRPVQRRLVVLY